MRQCVSTQESKLCWSICKPNTASCFLPQYKAFNSLLHSMGTWFPKSSLSESSNSQIQTYKPNWAPLIHHEASESSPSDPEAPWHPYRPWAVSLRRVYCAIRHDKSGPNWRWRPCGRSKFVNLWRTLVWGMCHERMLMHCGVMKHPESCGRIFRIWGQIGVFVSS